MADKFISANAIYDELSDILIRGMKMPGTCFMCPLSFLNGERLFCCITKEEVLRGKIAPECPLFKLPPHGDPISKAETVNAILGEPPEAHYPSWYAKIVNEIPAIVPSNKEPAIVPSNKEPADE